MVEITGRVENDINFLTVIGDIDMFTSKSFKEQLYKHIWKSKTGGVQINLMNVNYIDSSGLAVLYSFTKMLKKTGVQIWISNANDRIQNIIALAGFGKYFFGAEYEYRKEG